MLNLRQLQDQGLQDLAPEDVLALAQQMLAHIQQQEREIKLKDVKIEKITFELARLKAWKFGAKTEAMSAEQRRLFEETLAKDEASLQAQLQQATVTARNRTLSHGDGRARHDRDGWRGSTEPFTHWSVS
ncbi:hypothetical protein [Cupriavidus sp. UYPR2.512]|uniref:IS66 family transposase n=1 Tax=Cupriavidus sp. UYPR2.512 TaxID=1080187 RepID=UPI00039BBD55|nr:hypothetical protein [Cupriavidus sp. UYPR2.512]UIF88473.1 transposase [Cupriavidus necator]